MCRGAAAAGAEVVQRCRGAEEQRSRGEVVKRCRGAEVKSFRVSEVQRCRCA